MRITFCSRLVILRPVLTQRSRSAIGKSVKSDTNKREKKLKAAKVEEFSSSDEEKRKVKIPIEAFSNDDDEEANEDLSLKIVQKTMLRARNNDPLNDGVSEIVTDLKHEKKKTEKKKKKKSKEIEVPENAVDNVKDEEKVETEKAAQISDKALETNPVEGSNNAVLKKLLRGPRYFDPPDNSWGACYNCGEEGHSTVNCTSARRKKPCFVCGSFDHQAKQCPKGRDCFICKQQGHRAKDCPDRNMISRICLKCGDLGHDMFSCRSDYCPDDLKEIQCYICQGYGHLCCVNYGDPGPREVSCYRCGLSGHTGLACTGYRADTNGTTSDNSCYKCGGDGHFARECTSSVKAYTGFHGDTNGTSDNSCYRCGGGGHFARECTSSSVKAGKRNREPSTPKEKSSKKKKDRLDVRSAPHDLGKTRKKNRSQYGEYTPPVKPKHRGGWITEDPGDFYNGSPHGNNWRSPATPRDRRNGDYASSSYSSNKHHNLNFSNSASNGSASFYQHRFSASRFGNSSNDRVARNYHWHGRDYL